MATVDVQPQQPDIQYAPDFTKYEARSRRRQQAEALRSQALPTGFIPRLSSELVWDGKSLDNYDWNFVLTQEDIEELEHALAHFKCENFVDLNAYRRTDYL
jgi:hypothetical protein